MSAGGQRGKTTPAAAEEDGRCVVQCWADRERELELELQQLKTLTETEERERRQQLDHKIEQLREKDMDVERYQ